MPAQSLTLSPFQTLYTAGAMVAVGLGAVLLILAGAGGRRHVRAWGTSLIFLGVHHVVGLLSATASQELTSLWARTAVSGVSIAAGYLFVIWFAVGTLRALGQEPDPTLVRRLSWAAVLLSFATTLPFATAPFPSMGRNAVRVGLRSGVTAVVLFALAHRILRAPGRQGTAARMLGAAVLATALLNTDYLLSSVFGVGVGTFASGGVVLLVDLAILTALGMACVGWLADEERHRGDRATEALEREQERALLMFEHVLDTIVEVRADGTLLYVSPRGEVVTGFSVDELVGTNFLDRIHPEDRDAAADALMAVRGTGRSREVRFQRADGKWRWLETVGRPIEDSDGDRLVITARDVTERKELNDRLTRSQKLEITGRLVGAIAHDFNNVLTVVQAHSELLLDEIATGDPWRDEIEDIMSATERASRLIRRLLAFTRRGPSVKTRMDLNATLLDLETFLGRIMGDSITVALELSPDAPTILADQSEMESVLLNLAVNAREAMPGGGDLRISTARVDRAPADGSSDIATPHLHLTVRDTGAGIPGGVEDKIFEPFFTTKPGTGTGLGLATVLGVVREGGGTIDVTSSPGQGATFDIHLPATDSERRG